MNAYNEMKNGIDWVLNNRTSYKIGKDLNINKRTANRYQNGTTAIGNMTLETAEKLYNYYLAQTNAAEIEK